jgi:hypothetical protein
MLDCQHSRRNVSAEVVQDLRADIQPDQSCALRQREARNQSGRHLTMALSRRTGAAFPSIDLARFRGRHDRIAAGLMFVLTIFMVLQFVLQETINGAEKLTDRVVRRSCALAEN